MKYKLPYLFLLGGHDLEMLEIRKILVSRNIPFYDENVHWGAKLSGYKDILEQEKENYELIYGVELIEDIDAPINYRSIDHHGEYPPRPTSYEQVAELLGVDISDRRSQLVIMNDVGHKKGLLSICATKDEIDQIRKEDRDAQGIPEAWMEIAKEEIEKAKFRKSTVIIETQLDSFTPIADQVNYSKLIIHNSTGLTYYGDGANTKLKEHFSNLLEDETKNLAYCGGMFEGFIGFTEEAFKIKSKEGIMNEIIEQVGNEEPFSTHAFMLPLKWDYIRKGSKKEDMDFDLRTDLKKFNEMLIGKSSLWKRKFYRIDGPANYNEITYFHSFVSKVIFDLQQRDEKVENTVGDGKVMLYYEIETGENAFYEIHIAGDNFYRLKLTGISLHAYYTGVLIISFNMENYLHSAKEDILKINEYGRRFYPQFLDNNEPYTELPKNKFLACKIRLKINDETQEIEEDFRIFNKLANLKTPCFEGDVFKYNTLIHPPNFITKLFSDEFVYNRDDEAKGNVIRLARITDDRMFFQCWYGNEELANNMGNFCNIEDRRLKLEKPAYLTNEFWYAFINGDKSSSDPSVKNDKMQEEQMDRQTYSRWIDYYDKSDHKMSSTIYGFSRDSFVCLGGWSLTKLHMKTMYYHIAVLCLAQRASVLRFSAENTIISNLVNSKNISDREKKQITERIRSVYKNYIEFINKIYFREVSSQIQAIEMYNQFQEVMNIHKDVKDLDSEIGELHNYVIMEEQHSLARNSKLLNNVAFPILLASLFFGIMGSNFFNGEMPYCGIPDCNAIKWILTGIVLSGIAAFLIWCFIIRRVK